MKGYSLEMFSDMIAQQAERREAARQEHLKKLRDLLPAAIENLPNMTMDELLDNLLEQAQYRSDPKELKIRDEYVQAIRTEIKSRTKE